MGYPEPVWLQDRVGDGSVPSPDQDVRALLLGIRRLREIGDRDRLHWLKNGGYGILRIDLPHAEVFGCTLTGIPGTDQICDCAIDIAKGWHNRRGGTAIGMVEALNCVARSPKGGYISAFGNDQSWENWKLLSAQANIFAMAMTALLVSAA